MALTDKLSAIANAIRSKTGKSNQMTLEQMVTEIMSISTGGGSAPSTPSVSGDYGVVSVSEQTKTLEIPCSRTSGRLIVIAENPAGCVNNGYKPFWFIVYDLGSTNINTIGNSNGTGTTLNIAFTGTIASGGVMNGIDATGTKITLTVGSLGYVVPNMNYRWMVI